MGWDMSPLKSTQNYSIQIHFPPSSPIRIDCSGEGKRTLCFTSNNFEEQTFLISTKYNLSIYFWCPKKSFQSKNFGLETNTREILFSSDEGKLAEKAGVVVKIEG